MASIREAVQQLNEAVSDLTSLHVQTFSGKLEINIDSQQGFDQIRTAIEAAKASGQINVVAESLIQFDGDSYNFVAADAPATLLKAHQGAVETGLKTRQSLLELFSDALGL